MNIAFHTLGCRLNEAEIEKLQQDFLALNHKLADNIHNADILILNTCGVTLDAMRKSRSQARKLAAYSPKLLIILGCAVNLQNTWDITNNIPYIVIPNEEKKNALNIICEKYYSLYPQENIPQPQNLQNNTHLNSLIHRENSHLRSFVKIQDGCNNACTYCAVHIARGKEKSESADSVIQNINNCIQDHAKEIILTGVQLGAWKENNQKLPYLLKRIENETTIQRIRLSSIEPWHINDDYIKIWQNLRFCPHFHIPLQSGSNDILSAMKRRTSVEIYTELIQKLRENIPNVRISTDLIVGFPGETDQKWDETLETLHNIKFDDLHLFRFSPRPNTPAATMPNQMDENIKRKRWADAHALFTKQQELSQNKWLNTKHNVLWETKTMSAQNQTWWTGYTENYIRVETPFDNNLNMRNNISKITITSVEQNKFIASLD